MKTRALAALAFVPTLLLSALPGPAYADLTRVTVKDAHGDIDHPADIWRVRVSHAAVIRVHVKHDNLRPHPKRGAGMTVFIDSDPGQAGPEYLLGTGLMDGTDYLLSTADGWRAGEAVSCKYRVTLDYADDLTHMWFGRKCFGRPAAVRVAVKVGAEARGDDGKTLTDWLVSRRHFTPWVSQA